MTTTKQFNSGLAYIIFLLVVCGTVLLALSVDKMMNSTEELPPQTYSTPVPDWNVEGPIVIDSRIGDAFACMRVEAATFPFNLMIADGHIIDYTHNRWVIDGEIVGDSAAEDDDFDACGSVELINTMLNYQEQG